MSSPRPITSLAAGWLTGADGCTRRLLRWCVSLALLIVASGLASGEEPVPAKLENQVKAAFLVKFASFIEWPASEGGDTNAPFAIGLLGRDPFGKEFDEAIKRERVKDRPVELRRSTKLERLADCQIVYVAGSELNRLEEIITAIEGRPVLLVTDAPDAVLRGSQINFIKEGGKVRFEINVAAAEQAHLKFSAKLLQVGRIVVHSPLAQRRNP